MALKGKKLTEEHKRKIGLANSIALLGKKQSLETIEKRVSKFRGRKQSKEWIKKRTVNFKGRRLSKEWRVKIGLAQLGKKLSEATKEKMRKSAKKGVNSPNWKGDDVKYNGLHVWVRRHLGVPDTCEMCGANGLSGKKIHWANKNHTYKRNLKDWIRLCVSCHLKFDKQYLNRQRDYLGKFI